MTISQTLPFGEAINPGQQRLCSIQVINWGTFHGRHELYVDRDGTLLTGRPGVGKSTLFDGIGHIFHAAPRLNESAHEASTRKDRRTTYSYMRGRRFTTETGTLYQRPGATWSAVALTFEDGLGTRTCIAVLFDLPAQGLEGQVGKHYVIGDGTLDTAALEEHGSRRFSPSSLMKVLPGFEAFDVHRTFAERFRRRLGIDNDKAFSLLRTLQNGKGLDRGVNQFFRYEVLEVPSTLKAAAGAVEDFSHLRGIHRQLEEARAQRDALELVPEQHRRHQELTESLRHLQGLGRHQLPLLREHLAAELLGTRSAAIAAELKANRTAISEVSESRTVLAERVRSLTEQHDSHGGQAVQALERELEAARSRLAERQGIASTLKTRMHDAGVALTFSASGLQAARRQAAVTAETLQGVAKDATTMEHEAIAASMEAREKAQKLRQDIDSYARRGSNIDGLSAAARRRICSETGSAAEDLPFAGELMDMAPGAGPWRAAAEKALRSLATTLLVGGEDIERVTAAADRLEGYGRLRWIDLSAHVPGGRDGDPVATAADQALVTKLEFKLSEAGQWLQRKIAADHDFICVATDADLHAERRAISRAGTIKSGRGSFERDTRPVAASDYLLGFTNEEKISELTVQVDQLDADRAQAEELAAERSRSKDSLARKLSLLRELVADERPFSALDSSVQGAAVEELETRIAEAMDSSTDLAGLRTALEAARTELESAVGRLAVLRNQTATLESRAATASTQLEAARASSAAAAPEAQAREELGAEPLLAEAMHRLEAGEDFDLAELDAAVSATSLDLGERTTEVRELVFSTEATLTETFRQFARDFGMTTSASFGTGIESAPHYVALHRAIVQEGLPQRQEEFREYFSNRSYERFSDLLQLLEEERRGIGERILPLNQILADVPFEHGSYLRLEVTTVVPEEARDFRTALKEALGNAYGSRGVEELSANYKALEQLVDALDDPARQAWRDTVLDVRQHVRISCNEHKPGGEIENGLEPGTLSGGEGQRFTSFIMGAALAYQLGFALQGFTTYGTVMIDEAFIQANAEYAAAGINALQEFGFQLLLAAPEDKIDLALHLGSVSDIIKHPASNVSGFVETGRSPALATDIILR
ncbi:MAG: chromosome segregation protein SMC [Micrococcaceae bacterium]|nr:chromosome segregation protein SMC [Micrococcaceae bacterium]